MSIIICTLMPISTEGTIEPNAYESDTPIVLTWTNGTWNISGGIEGKAYLDNGTFILNGLLLDFTNSGDYAIQIKGTSEGKPVPLTVSIRGNNVINTPSFGISVDNVAVTFIGTDISTDSLTIKSTETNFTHMGIVENYSVTENPRCRLAFDNVSIKIDFDSSTTAKGISVADISVKDSRIEIIYGNSRNISSNLEGLTGSVLIDNSVVHITYGKSVAGSAIRAFDTLRIIRDSNVDITLDEATSQDTPTVGILAEDYGSLDVIIRDSIVRVSTVSGHTAAVRIMKAEDPWFLKMYGMPVSCFQEKKSFKGSSDGTVFSDITSEEVPSDLKAIRYEGFLKHSVTYVITEGKGTPPIQTDVREGESFIISDYRPTREGYVFKGWSDGNRTYFAGDAYIMGPENVVLVAEWSEVGHAPAIASVGIAIVIVLWMAVSLCLPKNKY